MEARFSSVDRLFLFLFAVAVGLNLFSIAYTPYDLSPDEAQYAEWSKRIDWAYYSKGPAVAVLIRASTNLFGLSAFAVRLPAVCCFAFFSFLFYVFSRQLVGPRPALASWLAAHSMLMFSQMGVLMTTDAPAALMWLIALICAHRAVVEEESPYWIAFGAAVGLGVLAKYTVGLLYPSIFLLLFLTPHLRRHLIHPAFIAGSIVFCFALFPLLKWNIDHHWANFAHNAGHLVKATKFGFHPQFFPEFLIGQIALVGPIVFFGILSSLWVGIREWRQDDRLAGLLLFSALPLATLVIALSFTRRVYPNWPLPLYISGLLLLTHLLAHYRIVSQRVTKLIQPGILLSGGITVAGYLHFFGMNFGLDPTIFQTKKLVGWKELGSEVDRILDDMERRYGKRPFVVATEYQVASEVGFYTQSEANVLCANVEDRRMNQYDIWGGWEEHKGENALLVVKNQQVETLTWPEFDSVQKLDRHLPVTISDKNIRTFHFLEALHFHGEAPQRPERR